MNLYKLINWRDIIYIVAIQITLKFGFINVFNFNTPLTNTLFIILITGLTLIIASGFLVNYFHTSKNNKKYLITAIFLIITGLFLGFLVSNSIAKPNYFFIFLAFSIVVYIISISLKSRSFFRTLSISLLYSFSVLVVWWFSEPSSLQPNQWDIFLKLEVIIVLIAIMLFLGNLVRSILIDIAMYDTDIKNNTETIVTVFGTKKSKNIVFIVSIINNIISLITFVIYAKDYISFIILSSIAIPMSIFLYIQFQKEKKAKEYFVIVKILDYVLYSSIIIIPIVALILKNAYK